METEQMKFLSALFNDGELVNFGDHVYDKDTKGRSWKLVDKKPKAQFFTINPLQKGKTRADNNVSVFRNFLFEIDEIPLEDQIPLFAKAKFPFTTMVFSGRKSYHLILSLDKDLESRDDYDAIWKAIEKALSLHGAKVDKKCKNPSRLSRLANAKRDNGKVQELKKITKRHSLEVVEEWLGSHGIQWQDHLPKFNYTTDKTFSDADTELKLEWVLKYKMKNLSYHQGDRNNYQFVLARCLKNTGLDENTVTNLVFQHCGELHDSGSPIKSAFDSKYSRDESIYVPSKEERIAYWEEKNAKAAERDTQERFSRSIQDIEDLEPESINRYIRVGTDYYKRDPEMDCLIPWDRVTFREDFGSQARPPKCYDNFFYEPDYTSKTPKLEAGQNLQYRNAFQRPNYEVTPGDWTTIRNGLQHGFGDQLDLVLKWMAVSIIWPKQNLPAIVLVGGEDVGKSAVIYIFRQLTGVINTVSIKAKDFESQFNSWLENKQLVIIEEAGKWKEPDEVAAEFKRLITEQEDILIDRKNKAQYRAPFYGKFIVSSNDLAPLKMKGAATRFWVREITQLPERTENYYKKVDTEIGHFAWYLINEVGSTLAPPEDVKPRLYFAPEEFHTEAKDIMKSWNKDDCYEILQETFEDFFDQFPEEEECNFILQGLKEKQSQLADFGDKRIKKTLAEEFGVKFKGSNRTCTDSLNIVPGVEADIFNMDAKPRRKARWYTITRENLKD